MWNKYDHLDIPDLIEYSPKVIISSAFIITSYFLFHLLYCPTIIVCPATIFFSIIIVNCFPDHPNYKSMSKLSIGRNYSFHFQKLMFWIMTFHNSPPFTKFQIPRYYWFFTIHSSRCITIFDKSCYFFSFWFFKNRRVECTTIN